MKMMKHFKMLGLVLGLACMMAVGLLGVPAYAAVIFSDNFNTENGGVADASTLNYTGFANWTVSDGTVDLIGNGYFDFYPGSGLYVDLDGSTGDAGTMTTSTALSLGPGTYKLTFDLGGNQRGAVDDTVNVSVLVALASGSYTLSSSDPLSQQTLLFTVPSATTANIEFAHLGGDNIGIILDNIELNQVPEPGTLLLLGSGLLGLALTGARKKFRK